MADKLLTIYMRPDQILVVQFPNLGRHAFDEYRAYLEKYREQLKPGTLLLHDLRQAGYPGVAALAFYEQIFTAIDFPPMRAALLIDSKFSQSIYEGLRRRAPSEVFEVMIFDDEAKAVAWLLSPLPSKPEQA